MESFLLELGVGFTFVARQKRIQLDGDDFCRAQLQIEQRAQSSKGH